MSESATRLVRQLENAAVPGLHQLEISAQGEVTAQVDAADLLGCTQRLRDDAVLDFSTLIDVCGVDYSEYLGQQRPAQRYGVIYHLLSLTHNWRLRLRVLVADPGKEDLPRVPSVVDIWPAANWFERETFDLFGVVFDGHPDLRRILTDYGFTGHPFRKDFPLIGRVEMRYDDAQQRVAYGPVEIDPRVTVPRVTRDDNRYLDGHAGERD